MSEFQVHIGIEIIKDAKGEPQVETVWCNLPPSYVHVEVFQSKTTVLPHDNIDIDPDPRMLEIPDWKARYPFEVYTPLTVVYPTNPQGPGAPDEWVVHFELPTNQFRHVIVLNAPTAVRAIARVQETYPAASITSIRQADLETEYQHPQLYLGEEVLIVNDQPSDDASRGRK